MPQLPDEAGNVDVDESGHEVLAVETVHNAAVTRDGVGKILRQVKKKRGEKGKFQEVIEGQSEAELQRRCDFHPP